MRAMKDSGIEWIGEIPESWSVHPAKYAFTEIRDKNTEGKIQVALQFKNGTIIRKNNFEADSDDYVADTILNYTIVEPDVIMINGLNLNYDLKSLRVAIVREKGVITSAYLALMPDKTKLYPDFANYLFKGYETKMAFHNMGAGIRLTLGFREFKNQPVLFPESYEEQQKISAYLDRQCSLIDSVIEKTKASIEEYKKLRQAVITQAVTKGVRGDRAMKNSGIEWIGEIPEEWQILKSWYTMDTLGDIDHFMPESTDNGKPYLMIGDLKDNSSEIVFDKCKKISDEDFDNLSVKFKPMNGDVIFARYATIGTVCYVDTDNDFLVSYACVTIRPNQKNMTGKFMYYYFKSSIFIEDIRKFINSNTQGNVGKDSLTKFHMIVPSIYEQKEISEYLDKKCTEIDSLISKKEQFLTELESYKKSMIYEYVTGKKEVPQA